MGKDIPNIYTILEKMDFEKQAKHLKECILRHDKMGLKGESLKYNTNQVSFSLIQKFYEVLLDELD